MEPIVLLYEPDDTYPNTLPFKNQEFLYMFRYPVGGPVDDVREKPRLYTYERALY